METYLIVGAGRSGIDSAKLLLQLGKDFVLFDGNTALDTAAVCERIGKPDCKFILGALKDGDLDGIDICVTSPGATVRKIVPTRDLSRPFSSFANIGSPNIFISSLLAYKLIVGS